jgi:hypothetical protein
MNYIDDYKCWVLKGIEEYNQHSAFIIWIENHETSSRLANLLSKIQTHVFQMQTGVPTISLYSLVT